MFCFLFINCFPQRQLTNPIREARNDHPCDSLSRWRKYAISSKEGERGVWTPQIFEARYTNETDDYVTLMLNGFPRTVVKPERLTFPLNSEWTLEYNREYETCWTPQDYVDGSFYLEVREWISNELPRACERLQNPLVQFLSNTSKLLSLPVLLYNILLLITLTLMCLPFFSFCDSPTQPSRTTSRYCRR